MPEQRQKSLFASRTVWGVLIAAAGTVADQADILAGLVGDEWAAKAAIVAGLVLAFYGRLKADSRLTLALAACLCLPIAIGGCSAGSAARDNILGPAAAAAWQGVERDAYYGIAAQVEDGVIGEHGAGLARERVRLFAEAVERLD